MKKEPEIMTVDAEYEKLPSYINWGDEDDLIKDYDDLFQTSPTHRIAILEKINTLVRPISLNDFEINTREGDKHLSEVFFELIYDKVLYGNAFLEVEVQQVASLTIKRLDPHFCRVTEDGKIIILNKDKTEVLKTAETYPRFDGDLNEKSCIIHFKSYSPVHTYGVPSYIAGIDAIQGESNIKRWINNNTSSAFLSGVLILEDVANDTEEAEKIIVQAETKLNKGKGALCIIKDGSKDDNSKCIDLLNGSWKDWKIMLETSREDIITAHNTATGNYLYKDDGEYILNTLSDLFRDVFNIPRQTIIKL